MMLNNEDSTSSVCPTCHQMTESVMAAVKESVLEKRQLPPNTTVLVRVTVTSNNEVEVTVEKPLATERSEQEEAIVVVTPLPVVETSIPVETTDGEQITEDSTTSSNDIESNNAEKKETVIVEAAIEEAVHEVTPVVVEETPLQLEKCVPEETVATPEDQSPQESPVIAEGESAKVDQVGVEEQYIATATVEKTPETEEPLEEKTNPVEENANSEENLETVKSSSAQEEHVIEEIPANAEKTEIAQESVVKNDAAAVETPAEAGLLPSPIEQGVAPEVIVTKQEIHVAEKTATPADHSEDVTSVVAPQETPITVEKNEDVAPVAQENLISTEEETSSLQEFPPLEEQESPVVEESLKSEKTSPDVEIKTESNENTSEEAVEVTDGNDESQKPKKQPVPSENPVEEAQVGEETPSPVQEIEPSAPSDEAKDANIVSSDNVVLPSADVVHDEEYTEVIVGNEEKTEDAPKEDQIVGHENTKEEEEETKKEELAVAVDAKPSEGEKETTQDFHYIPPEVTDLTADADPIEDAIQRIISAQQGKAPAALVQEESPVKETVPSTKTDEVVSPSTDDRLL